ncbi:hypothetical protein C5167_030654 [Papaver somniferum]|nr:hypothetical protein C5167_030654 [Papaver somniferum]
MYIFHHLLSPHILKGHQHTHQRCRRVTKSLVRLRIMMGELVVLQAEGMPRVRFTNIFMLSTSPQKETRKNAEIESVITSTVILHGRKV